jgi:hypothetical protein
MAEENRGRRKAKALDPVERRMKTPVVSVSTGRFSSAAGEEEAGACPARKTDNA